MVKHDHRTIDGIFIGRNISSSRKVIIHKARLVRKGLRFIELLINVTEEKGPIESHVVQMQQVSPVRVDDAAEQFVEFGHLGDGVVWHVKLSFWLRSAVEFVDG